MPAAPSDFIWYELRTSNVQNAADFYGAVLGWTWTVNADDPQGAMFGLLGDKA